ncbi:MAG: DUF11 domain-containing protein [Clostridia bacterium]|nr:DUF11 domain-containing protein [Clostridia bacterium]
MVIRNQSSITYNTRMPDGETVLSSMESNVVHTEILSFSVPKTIRSDKVFVREGDTVHNTVTITNNSSAKLFNNLFSDSGLNGASYIEGSVKVNGVTQPTYDLINGFPLPDLNPGETVTIEYDIKVNKLLTVTPVTDCTTLHYTVSDPARGNVSYSEKTDTISLNVIADKIGIVKSVDKTFAIQGDILHYTITITNAGNLTKTDMVFKDPIPEGTAFVANSVKVNGTNYSVYHPEIGFALNSLAPDEVLTVEFDVKVN